MGRPRRMSMHKGATDLHRPAGPLPLAKLVECLQKLGGVGEAQLTFKRHMPTQACCCGAIHHASCLALTGSPEPSVLEPVRTFERPVCRPRLEASFVRRSRVCVLGCRCAT